jgi:hypothetical protein
MTISLARAMVRTMAAAAISGVIGTGLAGPAGAVTPKYDGNWSVLVITESGTCDRGYRYKVRVENGKVHYDGEAGVDVSGEVGNDGKLKVNIRRGDQGAIGTGKLSADSGSGEWQGQSATDKCSGRWQAERRAAN